MELVFVYGTLKRGGKLHGYLENSRFLGEGQIRGELVLLGWYPGLRENADKTVHGELFQIDDITLRALDRAEGTQYGLFERKLVEVLEKDGGTVHAWAYFYAQPLRGEPEIAGGRFQV